MGGTDSFPTTVSLPTLLAIVLALGSIATAGFTAADEIPDGYAPPWDVFSTPTATPDTSSSPSVNLLVSATPRTLTFPPNEYSRQLTVDVNAPETGSDGIIYDTFYVQTNTGWEQYTFPEETIGNTNWIDGDATASLNLYRQNVSDGPHHILALTCNKQNGEWACGCKTPEDCGYWQIQQYNVQKQESEEETGQATDGDDNVGSTGSGTGTQEDTDAAAGSESAPDTQETSGESTSDTGGETCPAATYQRLGSVEGFPVYQVRTPNDYLGVTRDITNKIADRLNKPIYAFQQSQDPPNEGWGAKGYWAEKDLWFTDNPYGVLREQIDNMSEIENEIRKQYSPAPDSLLGDPCCKTLEMLRYHKEKFNWNSPGQEWTCE